MYKDSYKHRKKYYTTLFTTIYVIIFLICSLVIAANWKYVKIVFNPPKEVVTIDQKRLDEVFDRVMRLENLSKQYNELDYQKRVVVYIRSAQYNTFPWNMMGSDNTTFNMYVDEHDSGVSSLRTLGAINLTIPTTKHSVDFYHMFATLNGLMMEDQAISDLSGWGGDLVQLAANFQGSGLTGYILEGAIEEQMNSDSGYFGKSDFNADVDAVNIYNFMKNNKLSSGSVYINSVLYYANLTEKNQLKMFKENTFKEEYSTSSDLQNIIYTRLITNSYIQMLCGPTGLNFDLSNAENDEILKACIKVFVKKLRV